MNTLIKRSPAKQTTVYDTYWKFAYERQRVFFARLQGGIGPWTKDVIIQDYKFTNVYRATDRVSQYLIREVIYRGDIDPVQLFFRILIFKIFNRIDTWELLTRELGEVRYFPGFVATIDNVLSRAMGRGVRIYSPAYIMPSGGRLNKTGRKHRMHLELVSSMIEDGLPFKLAEAKSMQQAFQLLRDYPTIGDFLAYQYLTDLNYSPLLDFDEMQFVMPGPGALNGISKCFSELGDFSPVDIIKFTTDSQDANFQRLGLDFSDLWGRRMQLIDCQNVYCEVDKYSRVAHPEYANGGRTRIKQRFNPRSDTVSYWFPPKWNLNSLVTPSVVSRDTLL